MGQAASASIAGSKDDIAELVYTDGVGQNIKVQGKYMYPRSGDYHADTSDLKWNWTWDPHLGEIRNGDKCLSVKGGDIKDGNYVHMFTCGEGKHQFWDYDPGTGHLRPKKDMDKNVCLNREPDGKIKLRDCKNVSRQKFTLSEPKPDIVYVDVWNREKGDPVDGNTKGMKGSRFAGRQGLSNCRWEKDCGIPLRSMLVYADGGAGTTRGYYLHPNSSKTKYIEDSSTTGKPCPDVSGSMVTLASYHPDIKFRLGCRYKNVNADFLRKLSKKSVAKKAGYDGLSIYDQYIHGTDSVKGYCAAVDNGTVVVDDNGDTCADKMYKAGKHDMVKKICEEFPDIKGCSCYNVHRPGFCDKPENATKPGCAGLIDHTKVLQEIADLGKIDARVLTSGGPNCIYGQACFESGVYKRPDEAKCQQAYSICAQNISGLTADQMGTIKNVCEFSEDGELAPAPGADPDDDDDDEESNTYTPPPDDDDDDDDDDGDGDGDDDDDGDGDDDGDDESNTGLYWGIGAAGVSILCMCLVMIIVLIFAMR